MSEFWVTVNGNGLKMDDDPSIFGYIDGDPSYKNLKSYLLHRNELSLIKSALKELKNYEEVTHEMIGETLWIGIVSRFIKCFQKNKARPRKLEASSIYRDQELRDFYYFDLLRNKLLAHNDDVSVMEDIILLIAIKKDGQSANSLVSHKSEIIPIQCHAPTFDKTNKSALSTDHLNNLVDIAIKHIDSYIDITIKELMASLDEQKTEDLLKKISPRAERNLSLQGLIQAADEMLKKQKS